jgi:hypothetical protein
VGTRFVSAALAVGLLTACGGSGTPVKADGPTTTVARGAANITTLSPARLLARSHKNALLRKWVHIESHVRTESGDLKFVGDAGPRSGRQTFSDESMSATVLLVGGVAYIRGNAAAVVDFFGFPQASAPTLAGKWISLQRSDPGYADTVKGVTMRSAFDDFDLKTPLSKAGPLTVGGEPVMRVSGDGSDAVYVSVRTGLPVSWTLTGSQGTGEITLSRWGKRTKITAPAHPVPISTIPR